MAWSVYMAVHVARCKHARIGIPHPCLRLLCACQTGLIRSVQRYLPLFAVAQGPKPLACVQLRGAMEERYLHGGPTYACTAGKRLVRCSRAATPLPFFAVHRCRWPSARRLRSASSLVVFVLVERRPVECDRPFASRASSRLSPRSIAPPSIHSAHYLWPAMRILPAIHVHARPNLKASNLHSFREKMAAVVHAILHARH